MTYEERAKIVEEALVRNGGNMVAALKTLAAVANSGPGKKSKITAAQLGEMLERRRKGAKLITLADDYDISEGYVSYLCAGVRPEVPPAHQVRAETTRARIMDAA